MYLITIKFNLKCIFNMENNLWNLQDSEKSISFPFFFIRCQRGKQDLEQNIFNGKLDKTCSLNQ